MKAPVSSDLRELGHAYLEWQSWLAVLDKVLAESVNRSWDAFVPDCGDAGGGIPMLADASIVIEKPLLQHWAEQLIKSAWQSGAPKLTALKNVSTLDPTMLFEASLRQDSDRLKDAALAVSVDGDAFEAVMLLLAVPFLQACNHRWDGPDIAENWWRGYCPVCGAWPALAEVRGIERTRYLRCGRCGGGWQAQCLFCPYCGTTEHDQLVTLVPERDGAKSSIEACKRCLGYVKSFTTLQGGDAEKIMAQDLASVALDVAALEQDFRRPSGSGFSLRTKIVEKSGQKKRSFNWR